MVASIWLQPVGDEREILRDLIAELAAEHGTMPFEPHLTVCTIADPAAELMQAAADYITACRALPLLADKDRGAELLDGAAPGRDDPESRTRPVCAYFARSCAT